MFKIPDDLVTKVAAGEKFFVAAAGPKVAKLCGSKICIEVPSDKVKLGETFYATATNRLVKRLGVTDTVIPPPAKTNMIQYKGKRVQ